MVDPRLAQLMAERAGLSALPSRDELVQTLLASRPEMRPYVEQLLQNRERGEEPETEDEFAVPSISLEDLEGGPAEDEIPGLAENLEVLIQRLTVLAQALGACGACWGEAGDCPECAGSGAPGWLVPDAEAFQLYVVPAVRRASSAARTMNTGALRQPTRKENRHV